MEVHYDLEKLPDFTNAVITIGAYDGVHHGHRAIIQKIVDLSKEVNGESILMTFHPHPRKIVFPKDKSLRLITTHQEKLDLLSETGLDHVVIVPFTIEFSQISPEEYIEKILIEKLKAKHVVIGYDHKFGLNRSGDIHLLKAYADHEVFKIYEIPEQDINDLKVSSTEIRKHLQEGRIAEANTLLHHPFLLSGKITQGLKLAGSLGYPTANIKIDDEDKLIPKHGTYAARCTLGDELYDGMVYIGQSKTLHDGSRLSVEMNIFHEFRETFYGEALKIHLLKYIREDQVFDEKEELLYNIAQDKIACENFFRFHPDQQSEELTIAILNWNGREHLAKYLPTMYDSYSGAYRIAVIDNDSDDGSTDYLRQYHPEVQIISLAENFGFAEGYNRGMEHIDTPYVAIVNSDVAATSGWLDPIMQRYRADKERRIAAIQPKILADQRRDYFEYAGAAGGFIDAYGYPFCRGRLFDDVEQDRGQYDTAQEIFWATGAAMVVRTDVFRVLGGFDGDFFAHMEEIDLCWRMKQAGYQIWCEPASTVYHLGGGTLNYNTPRKTFLNIRNNWWMTQANWPESERAPKARTRWVLDWAFILLNILKGKSEQAKSILKAKKEAKTNKHKVQKKRSAIQYHKKRYGGSYNSTGTYQGLIPVQYFLKSKKRFDQIADKIS